MPQNFIGCDRDQELLLPPSLRDWLPADHLAWFVPLSDAIPPVRGKRGRPRQRPKRLLGDRAYHSKKHRRALRARGITARIAKPKSPHGSGLGRERWVVERTLSWLHQYRRLRSTAAAARRHDGDVPQLIYKYN
jgi:transposase